MMDEVVQSAQNGHDGLSDGVRDRILMAQIAECWADVRNFDVIVWQIPAAISAIGGLMVTALVSDQLAARPWASSLVALGAAFVTFPLVVALIKNRIFQIDRNNWRLTLYDALLNGRALPEVKEFYPETAAPAGIVQFSSREVDQRFTHGPWYWRVSARSLKRISAYNVLFGVSLVVLFGEFLTGLYFGIQWLRPEWLRGLSWPW